MKIAKPKVQVVCTTVMEFNEKEIRGLFKFACNHADKFLEYSKNNGNPELTEYEVDVVAMFSKIKSEAPAILDKFDKVNALVGEPLQM